MIRLDITDKLDQGIELAPLIDIVFIVVVFLLLTANTPILSLPVSVPKTEQPLLAAKSDDKTLSLGLNATQPYWLIKLEGRGTYQFEDWNEFEESLGQALENEHTSVLVAPEPGASAENLLQLLAYLNHHQINDVQVLMEARQ